MTVEQMRRAISEVYSGWGWKTKVARMYDDQVIAVYYNFQERGMFDKKPSDGRRVKQLTIDDFIK